jgi:hypothetical protein
MRKIQVSVAMVKVLLQGQRSNNRLKKFVTLLYLAYASSIMHSDQRIFVETACTELDIVVKMAVHPNISMP